MENRVHAFLAQQREKRREEVARETNIFSDKGLKMLLGLKSGREQKRLLEALLRSYRYSETKTGESDVFVEKLSELNLESRLIFSKKLHSRAGSSPDGKGSIKKVRQT